MAPSPTFLPLAKTIYKTRSFSMRTPFPHRNAASSSHMTLYGWQEVLHCGLCSDPLPVPVIAGHVSTQGTYTLSKTSILCASCWRNTPLYHHHQTLWRYDALARRLIFALKYGKQRHLAAMFASCLLPDALRYHVDVVLPVPLHPKRQSQRGFNQMTLVGRHLSHLMGVPFLTKALTRHRYGASQGAHSAQGRRENLSLAFHVEAAHLPPHANVLLLDDVYTTGATIESCVATLLHHGAQRVYVLTLAKVIH